MNILQMVSCEGVLTTLRYTSIMGTRMNEVYVYNESAHLLKSLSIQSFINKIYFHKLIMKKQIIEVHFGFLHFMFTVHALHK